MALNTSCANVNCNKTQSMTKLSLRKTYFCSYKTQTLKVNKNAFDGTQHYSVKSCFCEEKRINYFLV